MEDGSFSGDRLGKPAVWIKELDDEKTMTCRLCPDSGKLKQLLKMPVDITQSIRNMKIAEKENPDNGPMRKSYPGFRAKSFFGGNIVRDFVQFFEGEDFDEGDDDSEQQFKESVSVGLECLDCKRVVVFRDIRLEYDQKTAGWSLIGCRY